MKLKKNAYEREIQIINSAAEMKILLQYNVDGKIGKINAKEIKQSILNEIENMKSENNDIYEENQELMKELEKTQEKIETQEALCQNLEKENQKL